MTKNVNENQNKKQTNNQRQTRELGIEEEKIIAYRQLFLS